MVSFLREKGGKNGEENKFATIADTLAFAHRSAEAKSLDTLIYLVTEFSAAVSNADFIGVVDLCNEFEIASKFGALNSNGAPSFDCSLTSSVALLKLLSTSATSDAEEFADLESSETLSSLSESCDVNIACAFDLSLDNGCAAALIFIGIDAEFDADEIKPLFFEIASVFKEHATQLAAAEQSGEKHTQSVVNNANPMIMFGETSNSHEETGQNWRRFFRHYRISFYTKPVAVESIFRTTFTNGLDIRQKTSSKIERTLSI